MRTDVAVIGGGAIGAAVAYFLRLLDPAADVCVIERDPAYELASTPRASGGVRRLFSLPENIELSRFSIDFFADFPAAMAVGGRPADVGFMRNGYLFIVPPAGRSPQRAASKASTATSSGRRSTRPVAPDTIRRAGASICVITCARRRTAALRSCVISAATSTA